MSPSALAPPHPAAPHRTPRHAATVPVVRALRPADRVALGELYAGLSPRARFLRFASGTPRLSPRVLARMVDLDWRDTGAWGAFVGDVCVGEVRLGRLRGDRGEVAVTVAEGWRRRGLGRRLLLVAAAGAPELGVRRLVVAVHPENRGAVAFVRDVLQVGLRDCGGLLEGEVVLDAGRPAALREAVASRG